MFIIIIIICLLLFFFWDLSRCSDCHRFPKFRCPGSDLGAQKGGLRSCHGQHFNPTPGNMLGVRQSTKSAAHRWPFGQNRWVSRVSMGHEPHLNPKSPSIFSQQTNQKALWSLPQKKKNPRRNAQETGTFWPWAKLPGLFSFSEHALSARLFQVGLELKCWTSMGFYGFLWVSMGFYGFPKRTTNSACCIPHS